jgi:predicted O-methyltransferase YrrM
MSITRDDPNVIVSENRRLASEVNELRQRIAAFESSRWWRLHPRMAWRRIRSRDPSATATRRSSPALEQTARTEVHDGAAREFRDDVVSRGAFSEDWFTPHIPSWEKVLRELEGRGARVLEIGSYEGLSACYLLWRLPDARLTCIDTFTGAHDYSAYGIETRGLEQRFDTNVALVDASRVVKLVGDSRDMLLRLLGEEREPFDVIYVDGSHLALDVIVDAALSWQVLAKGGLLIFDDYGGDTGDPDPLRRVRTAVDAFLALVATHSQLVLRDRQVIVRKTD